LPKLIPHHRITGNIVTAALRPECLAAAREVASQSGLKLTEWHFECQRLNENQEPENYKAKAEIWKVESGNQKLKAEN
jgi:hypothetical protein